MIQLCSASWLSYILYGSSIREKAHGIYLPISAQVNKRKDATSTVPSGRNNWTLVFCLTQNGKEMTNTFSVFNFRTWLWTAKWSWGPLSLPINVRVVKHTEIIAAVGRYSFILSLQHACNLHWKKWRTLGLIVKAPLEDPCENSQVKWLQGMKLFWKCAR